MAFTLLATLLIQIIPLAKSEEEKDSLQFSKNSLSFALLASNGSVLCLGVAMVAQAFFNLTPKDHAFLGAGKYSHQSTDDPKLPINNISSVSQMKKTANNVVLKKRKKNRKGKKIDKLEVEKSPLSI